MRTVVLVLLTALLSSAESYRPPPGGQATRYRVSTWTSPCSRGLTSALPCCAAVDKNKGLPPASLGAEISTSGFLLVQVAGPLMTFCPRPVFRTRALKTDATATDGLGESEWTD